MRTSFPFFVALLAFAACNQPSTQSESPAQAEETVATPEKEAAPLIQPR